MDEFGEVTLADVMLDWVADSPNGIGFSEVSAISLPRTRENTEFSLYHNVLNAFFMPYRTGFMKGQKVSSVDLVKMLSAELEQKLDKPGEDGTTPYQTLYNKRLPEVAKYMSKYTVEGLKAEIQSPWVGCSGPRPESVVIEYLARSIRHGILVLDAERQDVCAMGLEDTMKTYDYTIVLLYHRAHNDAPPHFTLVMLQPIQIVRRAGKNEGAIDLELMDEQVKSVFDTNSPFIQAIYARIKAIKND